MSTYKIFGTQKIFAVRHSKTNFKGPITKT